MNRTQLGKITHATFGLGGYQECQIGFWLTLGDVGWYGQSCLYGVRAVCAGQV